jgi:hypothetical protein
MFTSKSLIFQDNNPIIGHKISSEGARPAQNIGAGHFYPLGLNHMQ